MEWMPPVVVGALVSGFIAIVGWLLKRAIEGVDERASRTERKVDGLVEDVSSFRLAVEDKMAQAHARVSDTNERVAALEAREGRRPR